MLRDEWQINSFNHPVLSRKKYFFYQKGDTDTTIDIVAPTEEDAWEKLGKLLGVYVEKETYEGIVSVYNSYGYRYADIYLGANQRFTDSLVKHKGRIVEIEVKVKD